MIKAHRPRPCRQIRQEIAAAANVKQTESRPPSDGLAMRPHNQNRPTVLQEALVFLISIACDTYQSNIDLSFAGIKPFDSKCA